MDRRTVSDTKSQKQPIVVQLKDQAGPLGFPGAPTIKPVPHDDGQQRPYGMPVMPSTETNLDGAEEVLPVSKIQGSEESRAAAEVARRMDGVIDSRSRQSMWPLDQQQQGRQDHLQTRARLWQHFGSGSQGVDGRLQSHKKLPKHHVHILASTFPNLRA